MPACINTYLIQYAMFFVHSHYMRKKQICPHPEMLEKYHPSHGHQCGNRFVVLYAWLKCFYRFFHEINIFVFVTLEYENEGGAHMISILQK